MINASQTFMTRVMGKKGWSASHFIRLRLGEDDFIIFTRVRVKNSFLYNMFTSLRQTRAARETTTEKTILE